MSTFRVIQISDTHLSRERSWFVSNFEAVARVASSAAPDLVINTGDIALDGIAREDDLAFARTCHDSLSAPLRAIPGNHDVGDNPWKSGVDPAITPEYVTRYRRHFGHDCWLVDTEAWLLAGINAQLFGSGLPEEAEQWVFLESLSNRSPVRPLALFLHKPLFNQAPDESDVSNRYVTPDNRRRLCDALRGCDLRLVSSGHVHQHRLTRVDGIDHCWAPSTAYVLPDRRQPRIGHKRVGYVDYRFHPERVEIAVVEAPELVNHDLENFPTAYAH